MKERENVARAENLDGIVESIGQLMEMLDANTDRCAASLYRAMFRHETDLNKLDRNYADYILGNVHMGSKTAAEDYKNYLQYIKVLCPMEYPEYLTAFQDAFRDEMIGADNEMLGEE